ncbi:MAG: hypothetical protein RDV48_01100 [Candidatus Eremiobacteraeota bacterium]|nr:hypothetical protein [Candidatus Eremiobacteraeota bacterium]
MKRMILCSAIILGVILWVLPACAGQPDNYWTKFGVGSWVLSEMQGGMQQKQTLIQKSPSEFTLRIEMIMNGKVINTTDTKIPLKSGTATSGKEVKVKEYPDSYLVKAKKLACRVYETGTPQGVSKSWVCDKVPGGSVKQVIGNNETLKVIDFEAK